jgi:hypothetical protein
MDEISRPLEMVCTIDYLGCIASQPGMIDLFTSCVEGLKGLFEAIETVFAKTAA